MNNSENNENIILKFLIGKVGKTIAMAIFFNPVFWVALFILLIIIVVFVIMNIFADKVSDAAYTVAYVGAYPGISLYSFLNKTEKEQDEKVDEFMEDEANIYTVEKTYYDPRLMLADIDNVIMAVDMYDEASTILTKQNWYTLLNSIIADEDSHSSSQTDTYNSYMHYLLYNSHTYSIDAANGESIPSGEVIVGEGTYDPSTGKTTYNTLQPVEGESLDGRREVVNTNCLNEPLYRMSWQEVYIMASYNAQVDDAYKDTWEDDDKKNTKAIGNFETKPVTRLSQAQIAEVLKKMTFTMVYNFYDAENGTQYICDDKDLTKMEDYAYIESEEGVDVPHDQIVYGETPEFTYTHHKTPTNAPAYAFNAYMLVEYEYDDSGLLVGRQITIDGQAFVKCVCEAFDIPEDDFDIDRYCEFVNLLPGSHYDLRHDMVVDEDYEGMDSISGKTNIIARTYEMEEPYSYYDQDFPNCGLVKLGRNCPRHHYGEPLPDGSTPMGIFPSSFLFDPNSPAYDASQHPTDNEMIAYAMQFLGNPYVYGGNDLYNGIDCSHFVAAIYSHFGVSFTGGGGYGRYSANIASSQQVSLYNNSSEIRPTDLLFVSKNNGVSGIEHVCIVAYTDETGIWCVNASSEKSGIKMSHYSYTYPGLMLGHVN